MRSHITSFSPWLLYILTIQVFFSSAFAQIKWGKTITRTGWTATADSFQDGNGPVSAVDRYSNTFWYTAYPPDVDRSTNGRIGEQTVRLSNDGKTWTTPVQNDTFIADKPHVNSPDPTLDGAAFTPLPTSQGRWGQTVVLPIVPASGAVTPGGEVILWGGYIGDDFGRGADRGNGITKSVSWNPSTGKITERTIKETAHEMFGSGTALDAHLVTVASGYVARLPDMARRRTQRGRTAGSRRRSSSICGGGNTFSLVPFSSTTHTVNTDQRRVPLFATKVVGASHAVAIHGDTRRVVVSPGYYILFAVNSAGVPSVAKTIKILPPVKRGTRSVFNGGLCA
ncbi:putative galactose oxidase precursor [Rosellinia necatrix]|uniref:Putative galactose oxidase n=1 Tax=Rosellinia necatrix TaxID=77044 RepID=A0A1S7UKK5_ROSNE|nr:putative galactose oxidase precursor [Rosellinia necatrix]